MKMREKSKSKDSFWEGLRNKEKIEQVKSQWVQYLDKHIHVIKSIFYSDWYLNEYSDIRVSVGEAFDHFISEGLFSNRSPNPYFDAFLYESKYGEFLPSNTCYLLHYLEFGWKERKITSAIFDGDWYLKKYRDVKNSGMNPLVHYVLHGKVEGRLSRPSINAEMSLSEVASIEKLVSFACSDQFDVVSFDVFDTLLVRPVVKPTDLFKIVGQRLGLSNSFLSIRTEAERAARNNRRKDFDEVTIDEIYEEVRLKYGFSPKHIEEIKKTEIDVELQYLRPRMSVQAVFNAAVSAGKKVVITSDMYLPGNVIKKALQVNGFDGFEKIYLSSELRVAKGSGRLFKHIIDDLGYDAESARRILHIGDNAHADIKRAKENGISTAFVKRSIEIAKRSGLKHLVNWSSENTNTNILIGLVINKFFDDPYVENDSSLFKGDPNLLGYSVFGPLLLTMGLWMHRDLEFNDVEQLVHVYRDGYLPSEILKRLEKYLSPAYSSRKIYLSRSMRFSSSYRSYYDFIDTLFVYRPDQGMSVGDFVERRMLVDGEEKGELVESILKKYYAFESSEIGSIEQYLPILIENYSLITACSEEKHQNVVRYIEEEVDFGKKSAVWDVGYRGSASLFVKKQFDKNLTCYHLFGYDEADYADSNQQQVRYFIKLEKSHRQKTVIAHLTEDIVSSTEKSVKHVSYTDSEPEFYRESKGLSEDARARIEEIQNGAIKFAEDFAKLVQFDMVHLALDRSVFYNLYLNFLHHPSLKDAKILRPMSFVDSSFLTSNNGDCVYNSFIKKAVKKHLEQSGYLAKKTEAEKTIHSNTDNPAQYLEEQYRLFQNDLERHSTKNVVFCGPFVGFDKGTCNYLNQVISKSEKGSVFVINEAGHLGDAKVLERIDCDYSTVPEILYKDKVLPLSVEQVSEEVLKTLNDFREISKIALENIRLRHPEMDEKYAMHFVYYCIKVSISLVESLKPETVVLWNKFYCFHLVLDFVCKKYSVSTRYWEFGVLPGTFALDTGGQMGESWPALNADKFSQLPVSSADIEKSTELVNYLYESKLNRNVQPKSGISNSVINKVSNARPTIFYAGQNDFESGLQPYTAHSREYHSPTFRSTIDALNELSVIALENNWNIIYKPHPIMKRVASDPSRLPENVILVDDVDVHDLVDLCDLTVTILSQVAYVSLIRNKPVLCLGYTQLKGKGCTYEAFNTVELGAVVNEALEFGFSDDMREKWLLHVAQLVKYYLIDDLSVKDMPYALSIDRFMGLVGLERSEESYS